MISSWLIAGAVFLASVCATSIARRYAVRTQLLDHPNDRSSHAQPTPRGGGIGIAITSIVAAIYLWMAGAIDAGLAAAVVGGGLAIAGVGFWDDRGSVSVRIRMLVHVLAATWAMYCLGGLPPILWGDQLVNLGFFGDLLGTVALIWVLNLFNFMDGIDGLAASEAAFIGLAVAGITFGFGAGEGSAALMALCVGAASLGFLVWNWPPAKIFMGDVGSGYLGYVVAVLAIADARQSPAALFVWLILGGVFFVDSTITLLRRLARRERASEAHRSHAYQWLARRWKSHRRVTITVSMINVFWLFPCAVLAALRPQIAGLVACVALVPVAIAAIAAGAGRPEVKQPLVN